jgi:hypothetical protein
MGVRDVLSPASLPPWARPIRPKKQPESTYDAKSLPSMIVPLNLFEAPDGARISVKQRET